MNEIGRDLDPRYISTKFDHDQRKNTPGRALTGLCPQRDTPFQLRWVGYNDGIVYWRIHTSLKGLSLLEILTNAFKLLVLERGTSHKNKTNGCMVLFVVYFFHTHHMTCYQHTKYESRKLPWRTGREQGSSQIWQRLMKIFHIPKYL